MKNKPLLEKISREISLYEKQWRKDSLITEKEWRDGIEKIIEPHLAESDLTQREILSEQVQSLKSQGEDCKHRATAAHNFGDKDAHSYWLGRAHGFSVSAADLKLLCKP